MKSRSNTLLEPTSTKQYEWSFWLKETTGGLDGARTQDLHITSQMCNLLRQAASKLLNEYGTL